MDEKEYRQTYAQVNPDKCVFEKSINARRCQCHLSIRFNLADREGVACTSKDGHARCHEILDQVRSRSRFVFKDIDCLSTLPHNAEIRVQVGSITALAIEHVGQILPDINSVLENAVQQYNSVESLPYEKIVTGVSHCSIRSHRRTRKHRS
jgi:hypothetical protein